MVQNSPPIAQRASAGQPNVLSFLDTRVSAQTPLHGQFYQEFLLSAPEIAKELQKGDIRTYGQALGLFLGTIPGTIQPLQFAIALSSLTDEQKKDILPTDCALKINKRRGMMEETIEKLLRTNMNAATPREYRDCIMLAVRMLGNGLVKLNGGAPGPRP